MVGPPGAGKTLMASCVPSVLPAMDREEAIEVTSIQSIMGLADGGALPSAGLLGIPTIRLLRRDAGRRESSNARRGYIGAQRRALPG